MGLRAVGVRPRQEHQHVGTCRKGAPRLHPADEPTAVGLGRSCHQVGDVGPEVGLGHRDRGHRLSAGQLGQPLSLLFVGAALQERPGQDLGSGDERSSDAERAPAQLLGGHDHAHVVTFGARREAVVLFWDRQPEAAQFGEALDDLFGHVAVGPVHVLGVGSDLLVSEPVERLAHELEVVVEMARPGLPAQLGQELGGAEGRQEAGGRPRPSGLDAPMGLATRDPAGQVDEHLRDERAGQVSLGVATGAVVEHRPGDDGRRGGVGQVVGDRLVDIDAAGRGQRRDAVGYHRLGQVDRLGGRAEGIGNGAGCHWRDATRVPCGDPQP